MPCFASNTRHHAYTYARQACSRQFWKAGEYEGNAHNTRMTKEVSSTSGFDHARMHPRFLHSNATSHKWVLGAFAELLDNALDEASNGATHVSIDVLDNKKDGSKMLVVEDNGGGMDPEEMRKCMSLGYSEKHKNKETIGQYGNGFKTSTMRLGADVLVFSRTRTTQSVGLLSYTFLRSTGKEDIVVPMLDYKRRGSDNWIEIYQSSWRNWDEKLDTILKWSPFDSEKELEDQFGMINRQGTRIIIYNLWEDGEGNLELDLDSDAHDIQMRGTNKDENNIQRAEQYPNFRHFWTYRHSLRSYSAILYLRLPSTFKIILRGKEVKHHNILNDLMWPEEKNYRPKPLENEEETSTPKKRIRTRRGSKDATTTTTTCTKVTLGFVKEAAKHLDVQGFNVYHRNRLIMPFWRVWKNAGSEGRGVVGVIDADYINPAHDKQSFEHTVQLDRLRQKLIEEQKDYWLNNCQRIGYSRRRNKKATNKEMEAAHKPSSPGPQVLDSTLVESSSSKRLVLTFDQDKYPSRKRPLLDENTSVSPNKSPKVSQDKSPNGNGNTQKETTMHTPSRPQPEIHMASSPSMKKAATSKSVVEVVHRSPRKDHSQFEQVATPPSVAATTTSMSKRHDLDVRSSPLKDDPRVVEHFQEFDDAHTESSKSPRNIEDENNTIATLKARIQKADEEIEKQGERANILIKENNILKNQLEKANEEIKKQNEREQRHIEEYNLLKNQMEKANEEIKNHEGRAKRHIEEINLLKEELEEKNKREDAMLEMLSEKIFSGLKLMDRVI